MKYLDFIEKNNPDKLTKVWEVMNKGNQSLELIRYQNTWRKYVFSVYGDGSIFDAGCLSEILSFLIQHKDDRQ